MDVEPKPPAPAVTEIRKSPDPAWPRLSLPVPGERHTAERPAGDPRRERRRHERLAGFGAQAVIAGQAYPVTDVSIGGFRITAYDGPLAEGAVFDMIFRVTVRRRIAASPGRGIVQRRDGADLVALFADEQPVFYQRLCEYLERNRQLRLSYHEEGRNQPPRPAFIEESA